MLLNAVDVCKKYGDFTAVNKVSFEIKKGECLGLLGPNGAGKSTFISMIYGAALKTSGELSVFSMDSSKDSRKIKKRIGVVTQENALDDGMNVYQNMMMFCELQGVPKSERKERVDRLLKFMSIEHKANHPIRTLSGGMQRRLVFVRALLNDPELIILDEPTTGLDPAVRQLIWSKVQELKTKNKTVLLTTHYMDEAEILCDRIVIMNNGEVKAIGTPQDLIEEHCPGFVAVIKKTDESKKFVKELDGNFQVLDSMSWYQIRGLHLGELGVLLEKNKIIPDYLRPANLEDAFLSITGKELSVDA